MISNGKNIIVQKNRRLSDPTVNTLQVLGYDSSRLVCFKINITDEYELLPQWLISAIKNVSPERFYKGKNNNT